MASIKVNRLKLIKSLEQALKKAQKELEADNKERAKRHEKYQADLLRWEKDREAWKDRYRKLIPNSCVEFMPPSNYAIPFEKRYWTIRIEYKNKVGGLELDTTSRIVVMESDLPQKPEQPGSWSRHENRVEEITKILKLLKMSDEEKVSTGTYRNVAEYLSTTHG